MPVDVVIRGERGGYSQQAAADPRILGSSERAEVR